MIMQKTDVSVKKHLWYDRKKGDERYISASLSKLQFRMQCTRLPVERGYVAFCADNSKMSIW